MPKLDTLNSLGCMSSMNLVLTKQGLLHMELLLLETFQWNLYLPTAAHFIEYYLSIAVHEGDLHDGWPMTCLEKTKLYMAKYADYFLEVSLQGKWRFCKVIGLFSLTGSLLFVIRRPSRATEALQLKKSSVLLSLKKIKEIVSDLRIIIKCVLLGFCQF